MASIAERGSILVVEDDEAISALLSYNLEREGFSVRCVADGDDALVAVREQRPDLVLLDWMLPTISGLEVCRGLRRAPESKAIPIIILTARGEEYDRVRGLESGADDYVTKPFSPRELLARVRAVLRRTRPALSEERLGFGDVEMDLTTYRVLRGGRSVHLGPTEFRLLRHFLENPRRVFSREQLLDAVWGPTIYVEPRTVDVHIRRLRKALNAPGEADVIRTVRSAGYALETETASASAD
ncbi:MAG: phosphate regulon transcriptional regulatory protein PhoB [Rhodospirillaceae bacterium]|nr:phosphate regulon transcriptional regulatory protein PhoB [Rhodospirillaceae bacterium]